MKRRLWIFVLALITWLSSTLALPQTTYACGTGSALPVPCTGISVARP